MKTSAKRTSIVSILAAFTLFASFLAALLPITISTPRPVYATTTTVYFTYNASNSSCPINSSNGKWTVPSGVTSVIVLVVAGGGGGGSTGISYYVSGGGGAGGLIYNGNYAVTPGQNISVVVGDGGDGGSAGSVGETGENSQFGTITAHGGGGGGGSSHIDGDTGGSGGGGMGRTILAAGNGVAGTSGEGKSGGNGMSRTLGGENAGGGGGGNTSVGVAGNTKDGGEGGTGGDYSGTFGTSVGASGWFAGGGGGGVSDGSGSTIGYGGTGGGGNGGKYGSIDATGGTDGTGGGGGGAGKTSTGGGSGGCGIVIIKYTTYTIEYTAGSGGTVNGSWPQTVNSGSDGPWVLASANSCYHFVNWNDSSTTNPRRETNVTSDKSFTANFAIDVKTVTYSAGSGGTVNGSWPQNVNCGSDGPWVLATANSCYHFVNWNDSSTTNPRHETNVTSNLTYTANFGIDVKTVTYSAGTGGTVNGSWPQNVNCGADGPWVLASPDPSYSFVNWNDSSTTNPRHETNVTSNLSYTANFAPSNSAPTIGTVALWTTGGSPTETTSMSPQVEYNIKIPVTDNDNFNDLVTVKATLYYDSDGTYSEGEVPTSGNIQTCAILTWTKATNTLTIDSGGSSTWSVSNASSYFPPLSNTSGTFEFHFTPGKVATYTTGDANWHIYVKATDSVPNSGTGTKTDLTMNWYSEVIVNTDTISWGDVDAGLSFGEGDPSEEAVSVTYICNGAYNEQIQASTTWSGSPSGSATLDTGGTPSANEFSLKADDDGTLADAIIVSGSYQTFDTGTITSESGNTETSNSLWLSIGTPFTKATYSGTIYYQIAQ